MDKLLLNIQQQFNKTANPNNTQSLLQSQQINQDNINELLEKSSEAIMCGPDCQKIKVSEELKQKYLDAETNLQTAPIKLDESKKNYYVYTEGRPYYDNMKEQELQKKATSIAKALEDNFTNEVSNATTMNNYLNTAIINSKNTTDLLKEYLNKNQLFKIKLRERRGDILTNDRKTYYEMEAIDRLVLWYRFYWYVYYILSVVLVLAFIFSPSGLSRMVKIGVAVLVILYPYYIDYINKWVYGEYTWVQNSIPKNVYNNL